ncbi:Hsf-type dna-binding protein, partial [Globisporangium splendens]
MVHPTGASQNFDAHIHRLLERNHPSITQSSSLPSRALAERTRGKSSAGQLLQRTVVPYSAILLRTHISRTAAEKNEKATKVPTCETGAVACHAVISQFPVRCVRPRAFFDQHSALHFNLHENRKKKIMMALNRMEAPTATSPSSGKSKEVAPFLKNLRKMLDVESDEILRWTPNGRAFEIHDMEQMMDYVLPKYFKHRKYTSFQRQLNYFNFKKWTKSKAVVCTFSNEYFLRDQPDLAWRISRKKSTQLSGLKSHPSAHKAAQVSPAMSTKRLDMENYGSFHKPVDMAIMVPRSKLGKFSESYPSPTDMDMMLAENDVESYRYHSQQNSHHIHSSSAPSHSAGGHEMESLDWIDNFLPSLENHQGMHSLFGHHQHLRNSHYVYPSLQTASDFVSMATM